MNYYGTDPAQTVLAANLRERWVPAAVFFLVAGPTVVASWICCAWVFVTAGSCRLPMPAWELNDVRQTQIDLRVSLVILACASLLGAVTWRGWRLASVVAGLMACAPIAMLLIAHPDAAMWRAHLCFGGP